MRASQVILGVRPTEGGRLRMSVFSKSMASEFAKGCLLAVLGTGIFNWSVTGVVEWLPFVDLRQHGPMLRALVAVAFMACSGLQDGEQRLNALASGSLAMVAFNLVLFLRHVAGGAWAGVTPVLFAGEPGWWTVAIGGAAAAATLLQNRWQRKGRKLGRTSDAAA
jgi:hypothetical protein